MKEFELNNIGDNHNELYVNANGEDILSNVADTLKNIDEKVVNYGATSEGYGIKEKKDNLNEKDNNKKDIKVLGMKPLVFTVVSIGTIISLGITLIVLNKK